MKPSDLNELDGSVTSVILDDGYVIHNDWWSTLSINWSLGKSVVSGTITFFDALDYAESIPLGDHNTISMKFKDSQEVTFEYTFGISDISKIKKASGNYVTLRFLDTMSLSGAKTFVSKGYKDMTAKAIAEDVYTNVLTENPEQYEQNISQDGNTYSTYVLNGNKNISKNLNVIFDLQGMVYFKTRKKLNAIYPHEIFANEPKELVYSIQSENNDYIGIIDEWSYSSSFNLDAVIPDTKKVWFSPFDKQVQIIETDFQAAEDKFTKTDGAEYDSEATYNLEGAVESEINYLNPTKQIIKQQIMKNIDKNKNDIFINGTFENNVGDIVNVEIQSSTGKLDDIDEKSSGLWVITDITDHIGSSFYQIITLQRINDMASTIKK